MPPTHDTDEEEDAGGGVKETSDVSLSDSVGMLELGSVSAALALARSAWLIAGKPNIVCFASRPCVAGATDDDASLSAKA